MTLATLLLFALASGITIATPGPTVLLAMSNGSYHGVRAAAWGMVGAVLADMALVAVVASGLGVLLAASEAAFQALKWAGAAYLAYLGWRLLRTDAAAVLPGREGAATPGPHALFLRSFLVAITNPKALLFMSAFLPQFIDPAAPLLPQYLALAAILAVLNLAAMLAYALLGARMMRALKSGGLRWMNRLCGGALIGMAATLALYRRSGP
ncbi:MAG TPA: LysE family translocator [Bordetella sp.]|nr:LysE family translocator [Bordetella sp.]